MLLEYRTLFHFAPKSQHEENYSNLKIKADNVSLLIVLLIAFW